MPTVDITVNKRIYSVACDDGDQQRVRELAASFDAHVKKIGGTGSNEAQRLVLAGILMADELETAQEQAKTTNGADREDVATELKKLEEERIILLEALSFLTKRIDTIAEKIDAA